MSPFADVSELTIDAEWDNMCDIVASDVELPSSSKEVCKVLEEWTSDDESVDMDIMEVDEEIGSNFLCDDLFGGVTCSSPASPQEEFMSIDNFSEMFMACDSDDKLSNPRYSEAFLKLRESMKRSQETRMALTMKTKEANDDYARRQSVSAVLASIEASGKKLNDIFAPAC
jgi:vacuolar-type H+-ATPase catalytic subunit A/Vma1